MRQLLLPLFLLLCCTALPLRAQYAPGNQVSESYLKAHGHASFFKVTPIPDDVFARMQGKSYKAGCPVKRSELLYMESADNYVCIWYLSKGQLTKFLLRNSLKAMEEHFVDTNVLRCHRSYMVNFDQVKVIRREKEGIFLEMGIERVPDIPISKTYSEKVMRWFQSYSA